MDNQTNLLPRVTHLITVRNIELEHCHRRILGLAFDGSLHLHINNITPVSVKNGNGPPTPTQPTSPSASNRRAPMTTCAPAAANAEAMPAPIPPDAPVTNASFPANGRVAADPGDVASAIGNTGVGHGTSRFRDNTRLSLT